MDITSVQILLAIVFFVTHIIFRWLVKHKLSHIQKPCIPLGNVSAENRHNPGESIYRLSRCSLDGSDMQTLSSSETRDSTENSHLQKACKYPAGSIEMRFFLQKNNPH